MVKTLKSNHRNHKDLSKKRGLKQRAGMNKQLYIPHATQISGGERLLYDDYPRNFEIETHFPEQAAYTPLMYFSPMLAVFSEMKKFIEPNEAGNKFKLTSLEEFAKYVLSGPENTTILPNIVKKMDDISGRFNGID